MSLDEDRASQPEQGLGVGEHPTTSVRRFTSLFSHSSGLVDQIFFQCATGKLMNREQILGRVAEHGLALRGLPAEHPGDHPGLVTTMSALGWAKIVRTAAATISAEPFGTWARTLRRKCTRHRCHAAPSSTAAMACLSPVWASEMKDDFVLGAPLLAEAERFVRAADVLVVVLLPAFLTDE